MQGAEIGAHCTLRGCIVAGGVRIGDHCVIDGMSVIGEGVDARRRQRRLQRRAAVPRRDAAGRGAAVLMDALDRETIAAVDSTGQLDEVLGLAEHLRDALWRVDSLGRAAGRRARRRDRRRHGRLGRRARGWRSRALGPRLTRPLVVADGYALPGWAGPSTLVLSLELLGQHRGDARRPTTTPSTRGAPRLVATTGGAAGRARARATACR